MNEELINEIRNLNRLLVMIYTKESNQFEKIILLSKAGFQPKDISNYLGTTNNVVSVSINKAKKKGLI